MTILILAVSHGWGHHVGDIKPGDLSDAFFYGFFLDPFINIAAVLCIKTSIALTLLRMTVQKRFRIPLYATMVVMYIYHPYVILVS